MAPTRELLTTLALLAACSGGGDAPPGAAPPPRVARFGGASMGTTFTIQAVGIPAGIERTRLAADVARLLDALDQALSTWRDDSQLARFNAQRSTDWFDVTPDTWQIVSEARRVAALSGGALDVSVGPLVELWGFGSGGRRVDLPSPDALAAARARVGWQHLELGGGVPALRKLRPELCLDLSAVAKGHAVDRIAEHLEQLGIRRYLVEFGGELRGLGLDVDGRPWLVGVECPDASGGEPALVIELSGAAIATSGDRRNLFEYAGRRYGHVIDPRSGWPVAHGLASVSVVATSALRADALATALFVMGLAEGRQVAERQGLAALFIQRDGEILTRHATPALARWLADAPTVGAHGGGG